MSQDQNKYSYFLYQCNETPFSKDWKDIFGSITEETIKAFRYKVENPNNFHEAIAFAESLDKQLRKPAKYYDSAYRHFCDRGQIPDSIRTIVDEILNDHYLHLLLWKERNALGIPIKTGFKLPGQTICAKHTPSPQQNEAVNRLALYTALTGKTWRKFLVYLLVFNYVIPVTHLEIEDLSGVVQDEQLTKLLNTLFKKMKPTRLRKRQTNLVAQLLGINEEIAARVVRRDISPQSTEEEGRKISRTSKAVLRQLLKNIYPKERNTLAKKLEAVKRRRLRTNKKAKKQLEEMLEKIEKKFPPSSPKSPKTTID